MPVQISKRSVIFLSLMMMSCSSLGLEDEIPVTNHTSSTVYVDFWDLESSHLVDPAPAFPIDSDVSGFFIQPDKSSAFSKSDIKGDPEAEIIRLFLYEIRGDSAYFHSTFTVSSFDEINIRRQADGYVVD